MPTPAISPAIVLSEIRACLFAEVMARPAPEPVTIRRDIAVLIAASIGDVIDRVDALAEGAAAADRLARELEILKAEKARIELLLTAVDLDRIARPKLSLVAAERGGVVAFDEAIRSFRRDLSRDFRSSPIPPTDGGAA